MTLTVISIAALLFIGFHLLLFRYLQRRIATAKALGEQRGAPAEDVNPD